MNNGPAPRTVIFRKHSLTDMHGRFEMKRINHEDAFSMDGACTNWAEEFFSRMGRAEIGFRRRTAIGRT
jgi:hypothetical protein